MKEKIYNRKHLKSKRKDFRNNATSAEAVLWTYLKSRQLHGRKFRRQHSIDNYIVDFYCSEEKLIIELDGAHHFNVGGQYYDEHRDNHFSVLGLKVVRFENVLIFENIDIVLNDIISHFTI